MRNAFIQELVHLAHQYPQIALVVGDLGYSVVEPFADSFPDRFINAGVAEQNMMGLAAGMASEGYHVFAYSIANFPTFRCAEQIRNDIDYHRLPVTVVSVGGGLAYGALGYSHHAVQDYALMRSFPNMLIAAPGDPMEVRACMRYLINNPQPSYLRLGKAGEPCFHSQVPTIVPGRWLNVIQSQDSIEEKPSTFLTTGATLAMAVEWLENSQYKNHSIFSLPLWGMANKPLQAEQFSKFSTIVSVEDHLMDGGFGSWLMESIVTYKECLAKLDIYHLSADVCNLVGSQSLLNRYGGLTPK